MILGLARLGDVAGGTLECGVKAPAVLLQLLSGSRAPPQQRKERGGVLSFQALLHGLRGDHRFVVLGEDTMCYRTDLFEPPDAPATQGRQGAKEQEIADQQFRSK